MKISFHGFKTNVNSFKFFELTLLFVCFTHSGESESDRESHSTQEEIEETEDLVEPDAWNRAAENMKGIVRAPDGVFETQGNDHEWCVFFKLLSEIL